MKITTKEQVTIPLEIREELFKLTATEVLPSRRAWRSLGVASPIPVRRAVSDPGEAHRGRCRLHGHRDPEGWRARLAP